MNPAEHQAPGPLCGLWVDEGGHVHVCHALGDGRRVESVDAFRPFFWLGEPPIKEAVVGIDVEALKGEGTFRHLAHADTPGRAEGVSRAMRETGPVDLIRPWESQYLIQHRLRMYADLHFAQLRRCQLDIETGSADGRFSDACRTEDRVLAIGLRMGGCDRLLLLGDMTDAAEKRLLESLNEALAEGDPDVIEGHNIFKFDLDYLRVRCRLHKVDCAWGRFGQKASFRNSRLKVAERWIEFPRCDLPGRAVADTYLLTQLYDITIRELPSYGLKDVAVYFGITEEESADRTYIAGGEIAAVFQADRERFCAYLKDDLRETEGLADQLLPTYFEQVRSFPTLLQEATLRGSTSKIDLLFQEEYYHARQACPVPVEVDRFEGGFTKSYQEGVFREVLHFDVASLYPSLLLHIGRNPAGDTLGVFIPLLRSFREYRLKYKLLAKTAETEELRAEYQTRQASFKILINSFYGYLGFSGARFGDGALAAEVTRKGREMLQLLIDEFSHNGCTILEADTDGIYLSSPEYYEKPGDLLALVEGVLPKGIDLEYDGRYEAMFCYKAKNYALYDGQKITLRGSALRSRAIEPFLKKLNDRLIRFLLGASIESPVDLIADYRKQIASRRLPVVELAKTETLNQNLDAYEKLIAEGGKPRRASAEVALFLTPRPRMGERVSYYITAKARGKTSDWQRARALRDYDEVEAPYDPGYYLGKLDDWLERYGTFLGVGGSPGNGQGDFQLT